MNKKQEEQFDKIANLEINSVDTNGTPVCDINIKFKKIKQFISQIKAETRQEIVEEIRKERDKYDQSDMVKYWTLDDLIKTLK